jgi:acetylornithine deacetylase/succinyl-diaminopimelate desuccinylase-like protein
MNNVFFKSLVAIVIFLSFLTVPLHAYPPEYDSLVARELVNSLDIEKFKFNIKTLSDMGDRWYGSTSNKEAQAWLDREVEKIGYKSELESSYDNIMFTKVGTVSPDSCYIIGAHYDGRAGGGAADDNASGVSLIMEAGRAFFDPEILTHYSIRFIFFNCEESGISGSNAYVSNRRNMQGEEDPPGSGLYPEPRWLGMVSHDLILYDHGVPWQQNQIPDADIDVEYKSGTNYANQSKALAEELVDACEAFSEDYPAEVGSQMTLTDSEPFKNRIAAISVRENRRATEIEDGNPHYHKKTDVYESYSDLDFLLGHNTVQMTVGAMCRLAGVHRATAIIPKQIKSLLNNSLLSQKITGIKIFDARGKKIAEFNGSTNWQQLQKAISGSHTRSKGICIIQVESGSTTAMYKLLNID